MKTPFYRIALIAFFLLTGSLLSSFAQAFTQTVITSPKSTDVVGNTLTVAATITGLNISSVVANVDNRQTPLTLTLYPNTWTGTFSLEGLTAGNYILTVTTTTAQGETSTDTVTFIKDAPPIVTVTEPSDGAVANPTLHVTATCEDDEPNGCVSLIAGNGTIIASSGTGHLDAVLDFSSDSHFITYLSVVGKDARGATDTISRYIFINTAPLQAEAVVHGSILDVTADRILYLDQSTDGSENKLKLRNRQSGEEFLLFTYKSAFSLPSSFGLIRAWLTSSGVIFIYSDPAGNHGTENHAYEWRENTGSVPLDVPPFLVKGDYALFPAIDNLLHPLQRHQFSTDTTLPISPDAVYTIAADISDSGDVIYRVRDVFTNTDALRIWHAGQLQTIETGGSSNFDSFSVPGIATDGNLVLYNSKLATGLVTAPIDHLDQKTLLAPLDSTYALNAGWIAFTRADASNVLQVWERSPQGTEKRITADTGDKSVFAVSPTGEVIYSSLGNPQNKYQIRDFNGSRNLILPISAPINNSYQDPRFDLKPYWYNGDWHFSYGNTVFSLGNGGTTLPPPACPGLGKGDVNADGKVSIGDVVLSLRMAVHLDPTPSDCAKSATDANCDGQLTVADSILILRHFLFGDPFPACSA